MRGIMFTRTRICIHLSDPPLLRFLLFLLAIYSVLRYPYVLVAYRRGAIELSDQLENFSRGNQHCVTLLNVSSRTKTLTICFSKKNHLSLLRAHSKSSSHKLHQNSLPARAHLAY